MWPILLLSLALNISAPVNAQAQQSQAESRILHLLAQTRAAHSLPRLAFSAPLRSSARGQALVMARRETIFHALPLHARVEGLWSELGEDVGMASTADDLFLYLMQSPTHRDLIVDPSFTRAAAGIAIRDGTLYLSLMFGTP